MVRSEVMVDYERFRSAKVAIFVDVADVGRSFNLLRGQADRIERLSSLFGARVMMVEQRKLTAERILEKELADGWVLLVSEGAGRALTTKKNPWRINVDAREDWEPYAFKELLRQVRESSQILEDVTSYYSRYQLPEAVAAKVSVLQNPN